MAEYDVLGFSASGHPFALLRGALPHNVTKSDRLETLEHGTGIQVAGLVVARQRPETAHGYTFILLEDEAGMINAIVRPKVYERDRLAIRGEPFLTIAGTLARDDGTVNVIAEEVRPLALQQRLKTPDGTARSRTEEGSPYRFLKHLRRNAPDAKSWG